MYGISSSGKEAISVAVERMFDLLAHKLLGNIPKLRNKPQFYGSTPENTLAHIFIQALGNKEPNHLERDVLRSILNSSYGYIESLKNKTSSNVVESVDAIVKEAKTRGSHVNAAQVAEVIAAEMEKARNQMKVIAEAETTKTRNMAHTMEIAGNAKNQGVEDPTVFFIVVRDGLLCEECKRLHMMPDGITPRCFKMSELSMNWHKRGDDRPSACGEHPNCRCFYDGNSPVITERGTIPLKKVVIGDRVLTHTGKFKKVLATFGQKGIPAPVEDLYRIEFLDPQGKIRKLRVTKDHLLLTQRGWVRADELIIGQDTLKFLYKECENCKKAFPHNIDKKHKRYCSLKCANEINVSKASAAVRGKKQSKKSEDVARDAKLNDLGWHVLRYNPETGFKNVLGDVRRVSLNSTNGYSFNDVPIVDIVIVDSPLVSRTARLYDITVEDDASFVIMGIISHNCSLSQLPPGWGFKNGFVSFIDLDHDEYAKQRD